MAVIKAGLWIRFPLKSLISLTKGAYQDDEGFLNRHQEVVIEVKERRLDSVVISLKFNGMELELMMYRPQLEALVKEAGL